MQTIQILGAFIQQQKKKQFISRPWKIGEIFVKKFSHLDEFTTLFGHLNLKGVQAIQVFDPKDLFSTQMLSIYSKSFVNLSCKIKGK